MTDPTKGAGAEISGAQSLITSLEAAGVTDIFGIPGGAILPAYDPLMDSTRIRHILVRHEQGAGHAAQGYAAAIAMVQFTIVAVVSLVTLAYLRRKETAL